MEELNDDELQELLGYGSASDNSTLGEKATSDLLAYQELFKALETEPSSSLSLSFAANVRRRVQERLNRKSDIRFNSVAVIIFVFSLVLGYGLLQLISQPTADLVSTVILEFKWIFLSAIGLFFCVLLIDQRFIKREY
jgi:hypothetical protein